LLLDSVYLIDTVKVIAHCKVLLQLMEPPLESLNDQYASTFNHRALW